MLSNYSINVVTAYDRGYRVRVNGDVVNKHGKLLVTTIKNNRSTSYRYFTIRIGDKSREKVFVHRLVGYQKFGDVMFNDGMQIRHMNNDSFDNSHGNIEIGSNMDNQLDRPILERTKYAILASQHNRKVSDDTIIEIRHDRSLGMTYSQLMDKYNISSKGTMYELLNREYITKK